MSVVIWHFDRNLNSIKILPISCSQGHIWHLTHWQICPQNTTYTNKFSKIYTTDLLMLAALSNYCQTWPVHTVFTWDFVYYNFVWILSNLKSCISISSSFYRRSSKVTLTPVKTNPSPFFNLPFTIQQFTPQYTHLLF